MILLLSLSSEYQVQMYSEEKKDWQLAMLSVV